MRYIAVAVAVALALARPSVADPVSSVDLGDGMTLEARGGKLTVRKGKQWAALAPAAAIAHATVNHKKRTVEVATTLDDNADCPHDVTQTYSIDELAARIENATAAALHASKKLKDAAAGFARAVAIAPKWEVPAINLARVDTTLGDLDAASAALAPWRTSDPYGTYVLVALDPELAPLAARPEHRAIAATTPGSAQLAGGLGPRVEVLYSAERGLVAVDTHEQTSFQCGYHERYEVHDLATGATLTTIPVLEDGDFVPCPTSDPTPRVLARSATAAIAARIARAQAVLVALGFSPTTIDTSPPGTSDDGDKWKVYLEKAKLGVVVKNRAVRVLRGNTTLGTAGDAQQKIDVALYLPDVNAMVVRTFEQGMSTCGPDPLKTVSVIKLK